MMIFQSRFTNIESSGIILSRIWREHRRISTPLIFGGKNPWISCDFLWIFWMISGLLQYSGPEHWQRTRGLVRCRTVGEPGCGLRKMWRWVLTCSKPSPGVFLWCLKIGYPMVPPSPSWSIIRFPIGQVTQGPSENLRRPSCGQNTRILPKKTWVTHNKSGSKTDTSTKNDAVAMSDLPVENQVSSSLECWTCECCTLECPKVWSKLRWPSLYKLTLAHPSLCNNKSRFILECRDFNLLHDMLYYMLVNVS